MLQLHSYGVFWKVVSSLRSVACVPEILGNMSLKDLPLQSAAVVEG